MHLPPTLKMQTANLSNSIDLSKNTLVMSSLGLCLAFWYIMVFYTFCYVKCMGVTLNVNIWYIWQMVMNTIGANPKNSVCVLVSCRSSWVCWRTIGQDGAVQCLLQFATTLHIWAWKRWRQTLSSVYHWSNNKFNSNHINWEHFIVSVQIACLRKYNS